MSARTKEQPLVKRDGYPAGVPCWVDSGRGDPAPAVAFYSGLFGWEFENRMPAGAPLSYNVATVDGLDVAAVGHEPDASGEPIWNTYIWVESAEVIAARVQAAGGTVAVPPFQVGEAGVMAVFLDPAGAMFSVWEPGSHRGAQLVNTAGSWNWSELHTRDPAGAREFYGTVFGWELSSFDEGYAMWRMPGYGDFLAERDPDIRERQAADGAPEGFEDSIAWLVPITDESPSRWSVTFAVDDCDAVAARAAELGGSVLVAPYDVGPTRNAVLADPDGTVFSVCRYTPESEAA